MLKARILERLDVAAFLRENDPPSKVITLVDRAMVTEHCRGSRRSTNRNAFRVPIQQFLKVRSMSTARREGDTHPSKSPCRLSRRPRVFGFRTAALSVRSTKSDATARTEHGFRGKALAWQWTHPGKPRVRLPSSLRLSGFSERRTVMFWINKY